MDNSVKGADLDFRLALAKLGFFALPATTRTCDHGYRLHRMEVQHAIALAQCFDYGLFITARSRKIRLKDGKSGNDLVWKPEEASLLVRDLDRAYAPMLDSQLPTKTTVVSENDGLWSVEGFWENAGVDRILLTPCSEAADITSRAWLRN